MYHRTIGEDAGHSTVEVAKKIRKLLSRAIILFVIMLAAPSLYELLTNKRLDSLIGGDPIVWETIQWSILVGVIFMILGLVGVARCTKDM